VDNGMPYVVPMNYGVTKDENDGHYIIYLHGANEGRKLEVIKANPKCCITLERNVQAFEGRIACQYGTAYESIIGFGDISIIEDVAEKEKAMKTLMKTQTGREDFEFDERLLSIVTAYRIDIRELTAKHRMMPGSDK
jgi:nitroimidazol reductase NimA-like FMN-containing flavoprotein (pyridoxamine 5'-phosphate oxidase superfamily)